MKKVKERPYPPVVVVKGFLPPKLSKAALSALSVSIHKQK